MAVSCYYAGRFGNIFFHAGHLLAYAKRYDLNYVIPTEAMAYKGFRNGDVSVPFHIESTASKLIRPRFYDEPNHVDGNPFYYELPFMDNVVFRGYWQSFLYVDEYRDYIIEKFKFPYKFNKGVTSISVRRGDCISVPAFPIAPREYYQNAIKFMQDNEFNRFLIHSDDLEWCKTEFNNENFPLANFEFYDGHSESENYFSLMGCENNITARSTFSLTAAWMNQAEEKIVCVPTLRHSWWRSMNLDLLTDTGFHQIDFEDPTNTVAPIPQFQLVTP